MHKLWNRKQNNNFRVFVNRRWNWEFIVDAKATDSFRDRNLSANYSCGLLRLRLESDWSQNNKHSRNNLGVHGLMGFTVTLEATVLKVIRIFLFQPVDNDNLVILNIIVSLITCKSIFLVNFNKQKPNNPKNSGKTDR